MGRPYDRRNKQKARHGFPSGHLAQIASFNFLNTLICRWHQDLPRKIRRVGANKKAAPTGTA
jgi:hypothetical protein